MCSLVVLIEQDVTSKDMLQDPLEGLCRSLNELLNTKPITEILRVNYVSSLVDEGGGIGLDLALDEGIGLRKLRSGGLGESNHMIAISIEESKWDGKWMCE
ncbi:hypothetical protein Tco_0232171 [Tanacetum coccineum]